MIIGCPKEIKTREYRVGLVPGGAAALTGRGHQVLIEKGAGLGSGIPDAAYEAAGAKIVEKAADVWSRAEMIVKVKEPVASEYGLMREGQTVYTYFHLAADKPLTKALLERKVTAVAYETIQTDDGQLPLLKPMSEVAGRMAVQVGAVQVAKYVHDADLVIGGVLIPGAKAPKLVSEKLISEMQEGSVVVDVAVDQGGCIETCHPTTHDNPTYTVHGVVPYSVANMPGAVAQTSTFALTNTTIGYGVKLAELGVIDAVRRDRALAQGVNTIDGLCTYKAVAEAHDLPWTALEKALAGKR